MKQLTLFLSICIFSLQSYSQLDDVCNASFESGLSEWQNFANNGAVASFDTSSTAAFSGQVGALISVEDISSGTCVLSSCVADMFSNQNYKMSFWARSDSNVQILATISKATPGYDNFASGNFTLTSEWMLYEIVGSVTEDYVGDVRLAKFKFLTEGIVMIDDIQTEIFEQSPEVCQGDFENGLDSWAVNQNNGVISAEVDESSATSGYSSAKLIVSDTDLGSPIFSSCSSFLPQSTSIMVHFWAKSSEPGALIEAKSSLQSAPYTVFGSVDITLTEEWQEYSFIAYAEDETNGVRLAKFAFQNDGEYWIDDVWLEEIPPTPVICNGDFELALESWVTSISDDASATISATPLTTYNGVVSAYAEISSPGEQSSDVQLSSCRAGMVEDSTYSVSVWMKGSQEGLEFNLLTAYADFPFITLHNEAESTSTEWTEYCWEFEGDSTVNEGIRVVKIQFLSQGTYYIDGATLNPNGYECVSTNQVTRMTDNSEFGLSPNPAGTYLNIEVPSYFKNYDCEIWSSSGRQILASTQLNLTNISLNGFEPGLYFLTLNESSDRSRSKTLKFIKN